MTPTKTIFQVREGEGAVIDDNGKKVAVYKDEEGNITTLSPVCTHMKCVVDWNSKEKVWECPCHKAQYAPDGKVIKGPAKKNLEIISNKK